MFGEPDPDDSSSVATDTGSGIGSGLCCLADADEDAVGGVWCCCLRFRTLSDEDFDADGASSAAELGETDDNRSSRLAVELLVLWSVADR